MSSRQEVSRPLNVVDEVGGQNEGQNPKPHGPPVENNKQPELNLTNPDGLTEQAKVVKKVAVVFGKKKVRESRLIKYDVTNAKTKPRLTYQVPRFDRMSAQEAGDLLHEIHLAAGLVNQVDEVLWSFDKALFFCHTINGGSFVQEGSGDITIVDPNGIEMSISLRDIFKMLGLNTRRFFRAFADVITDVNKEVIRLKDSGDPLDADRYDQLMQVAFERGLVRFPELSHDSADACVNLTLEERATVRASKVKVLASASNTAQEANPLYGREV